MPRIPAALSIVAIAIIILVPAAHAQTAKTVLDGVFTDAQAARGEPAFRASCGACHSADLSGHFPILSGNLFIERWREYPVDHLYSFIKEGMPPARQRDASATPIPEAVYVDIMAHILKMNGYPAGPRELTAASVRDVLLVGKNGPSRPPNNSVVMTAGCLSQAPNGAWILSNATEPARNPRPNDSTPAERTAAAQKPSGRLTLRLTDLEALAEFSPIPHKGHKMLAKGYVTWQPNAERISLTSLEMLDSACAQ